MVGAAFDLDKIRSACRCSDVHVHVCVCCTPPRGLGLYDFSIPVLTAAAGEEGFTALELFYTVFRISAQICI